MDRARAEIPLRIAVTHTTWESQGQYTCQMRRPERNAQIGTPKNMSDAIRNGAPMIAAHLQKTPATIPTDAIADCAANAWWFQARELPSGRHLRHACCPRAPHVTCVSQHVSMASESGCDPSSCHSWHSLVSLGSEFRFCSKLRCVPLPVADMHPGKSGRRTAPRRKIQLQEYIENTSPRVTTEHATTTRPLRAQSFRHARLTPRARTKRRRGAVAQVPAQARHASRR